MQDCFLISAEYLASDTDAIDFRNFGTSLSRRPQALKVWFLLRLYGIANMQAYVRRVSGLIASGTGIRGSWDWFI